MNLQYFFTFLKKRSHCNWQHDLLYTCCRFLARLLFKAFCRVHLVILDPPPLLGPCIVASSHTSHFEPALLSAFFPRSLDWVAMQELFSHPLGSWFFEHLNVISIDRSGEKPSKNRRALETMLKRLSHGRAIGIFPEGGIRSGSSSILEKAPMKPGFLSLSILAQAPIIPCVILGSDRLYQLGCWLRRPTLWMIIGEKILPPQQEGLSSKESREELEVKVHSIFPALQEELCRRFELRREDLPKTAQERRKA